jgi:hypothetical protein
MNVGSPLELTIDTGSRSARRGAASRGMRRGLVVVAVLLTGTLPAACGGSSKPSTGSGDASSTSSSASSSTSAGSSTSTTTSTSTSGAVTGSETAPGVVRATSGGVTATMHAGSHSPHVNVPWPVSFVVADGGAPTQAKVVYEYMFGGSVVAKRSNYTFTGHFDDHFIWPGSAVGYPLTFRAVITAGGQTLFLDYPVKVVH